MVYGNKKEFGNRVLNSLQTGDSGTALLSRMMSTLRLMKKATLKYSEFNCNVIQLNNFNQPQFTKHDAPQSNMATLKYNNDAV